MEKHIGWSMMRISIIVIFLALFLNQIQAKENLDTAIQLYGRGEFRQAVGIFQQSAKSSPKDAETRFWLAKSYMKIQEWGSAIREIEKAVELQPANPRYHLWLGRACGERASRAFFTSALSLARRVLKEFKIARDLAPKDPGIRFDLLEFYLQAPGIIGGGKDKAQTEAQSIANINPVKGSTARATIFCNDKKWDKAKAELTQATEDYPKNADVFKDLADFLLDRQDSEGALYYGEKALALDSQSKRTQLIVAVAKTKLGKDLDQAAATLRELAAGPLLDEDPSFEEANYWLGENYLARGDKAKARDAFKSALAFNPEYSQAKNALSKAR
jgi:tetratricopeptide (TPR) repeat protein